MSKALRPTTTKTMMVSSGSSARKLIYLRAKVSSSVANSSPTKNLYLQSGCLMTIMKQLRTSSKPITRTTTKRKLPTKEGFQLWKSYSFHKLVRSSFSNSKGSKTGEKISDSKPQQVVKANSKNNSYDYNARKSTSDHHLSVGKVSVHSSPEKHRSRWYFYMFGIERSPTEMKPRDIKWRQNRRSPSTIFASPENIGAEMVKEKLTTKRWRSGKVYGFL
ncbi:hypothetical protein FNV43_RR25413 [Rhamnella rubrinervis]|uniref:Uncharacterized protein n=1 Tax=Rhamnella rubrinervis TaxID=2594499 RepID=A0A8K0DV22_9ROSA|nr:hypothetical protein FNV43_RR25413 [Rhamnella rubrinervis]